MITDQAAIDVLIVDDDRYVAEAYGRTLSRAGYAVGYAGTGGECLEFLRRAHPRLVLLDVVLPDGNGVDVCAEIKSWTALGHLPVIQVSGLRTSTDDTVRGLMAGCDGYLIKPVSSGTLLSQVRAALARADELRTPQPVRLRILVVDDDSSVAKALAGLLHALGHTAHVTYTAAEGLTLAAALKPDVILHDLDMPGIDGYEAARRLRAHPQLARVILVACSATVDEEKARAAGFDRWLTKPFDDAELDVVLDAAAAR